MIVRGLGLILLGLALGSSVALADLRLEVAAPGQSLPGEVEINGSSRSPAPDDTLVALFRLAGLEEEDELAGDLAATISLVVELRRKSKPFWSSGRVAIQGFAYRFRRDPLDGTYEVLTPSRDTVRLPDRDTLVRYLQRVHEMELATRSSLRADREYEVHISAVLKAMDLDDPDSMEDWLSGNVSGRGALLGIPRFVLDASIQLSGLADRRAEVTSAPFRPWPPP